MLQMAAFSSCMFGAASDPRGDEVSLTTEPKRASEIEMRPAPRCPDCGEPMQHYGGSGGYICHGYKTPRCRLAV
jgi:tRNA(Ile2) C34 agmatinyltransferase TiaS